MWMPFLVTHFVWGPATMSTSYWVFWAGAAWAHLQGLASVLLSLTKADIRQAFMETFTYKACLELSCSKVREEKASESNTHIASTQQELPDDHVLACGGCEGETIFE